MYRLHKHIVNGTGSTYTCLAIVYSACMHASHANPSLPTNFYSADLQAEVR